jgi:peroxiredoxin
MSKTIKNVSLVANLFFAVGLGIAVTALALVHYQSDKEIDQLEREGETLKGQRFLYEEVIVAHLITTRSYLGMEFPKIDFTDLNSERVSTDMSNKIGGIVLLFPTGHCQPCLNTQLKIMASIHKSLKSIEDFQIVAISDEPPITLRKYAKAFSLPFPMIHDEDRALLGKDSLFGARTTLVLYVNSDNTIIKAHIPIPENPRLSALFFNEIQGYLPVREALFGGHFKGVRVIDVLRDDIDMEPIHHLLF